MTRRNNRVRHASLPPRRVTRDRPGGRTSSRRRSHGRCSRLTCDNNVETPGRSGPGDNLQGTSGNSSASSSRMIVGSRVENMPACPGSFSFSVSELFRGTSAADEKVRDEVSSENWEIQRVDSFQVYNTIIVTDRSEHLWLFESSGASLGIFLATFGHFRRRPMPQTRSRIEIH